MVAAPGELSSKARSAIEQARRANEGLAIAAVTLYELAHGVSRNRMKVHAGLEEVLREIAEIVGVLPLTPEIASAAAQLPATFPRDPFDRMVAATAIIHGVPLVTADSLIRKSGAVVTIW